VSQYTAYDSAFAIQPVRLDDGRPAYVLLQPLRWEIGYKGSGLWIEIPGGFVTDLASVPRIAWSIFNGYAPETAKAAAIHDWLRPTPTDILQQPRPVWDVQVAAGEFYHALKADGVPRWRRKAMYLLVAIFGTRKDEW
jgi:hypothetical protein